MKQVDKEAYEFSKYCGLDRWSSYYYQLDGILSLRPSSLLEIGVGDGVVGNYIKTHTGIQYTSVDVAEDLHPDVVGSVERLPFSDNAFDLVCAFEVLEHLPFERFDTCMQEIKRVSKKYALLSLPHFGPPVQFSLKVPLLKMMKRAVKLPYPAHHQYNGQHYWEIGKKGYHARRIRSQISLHGRIVGEFIPYENQYHHFYTIMFDKH